MTDGNASKARCASHGYTGWCPRCAHEEWLRSKVIVRNQNLEHARAVRSVRAFSKAPLRRRK